MLIANGYNRPVDTGGRNITGCDWDGDEIVASTDAGVVLRLQSVDFDDGGVIYNPS